jgi:large subunit ribosomal protein L9
MEVILREDVPGLGIIGDIVKVKPGFARNYLLPRQLAVVADPRNLGELEHQKRIIAAKKTRERGAHEELARRLGEVSVEIEARAGKGGKLFGSVTNMDVQRLLAEKGHPVDRRRIELREPIKEIGEYQINVRVGQDVATKVRLAVKPLGGELEQSSPEEAAQAQAEVQERKPKRRRAAAEEEEEAAEAAPEEDAKPS